MTRYISNAENLKLMMNLLRDRSRNIQFEAFHVFKVNNSVAAAELALSGHRIVGLCGQPKQEQAYHGHPPQKPREASCVLEQFS